MPGLGSGYFKNAKQDGITVAGGLRQGFNSCIPYYQPVSLSAIQVVMVAAGHECLLRRSFYFDSTATGQASSERPYIHSKYYNSNSNLIVFVK